MFSWLTVLRLYYKVRTGDLKRPLLNHSEGTGNIVFRWCVGSALTASVVGYFLAPQQLGWIFLHVPTPLRVLGVVAAALSVALIWWSHSALSASFSSSLCVTKDQRLVTSGPYDRVRHPMYTGYFALFVSTLLFSRSWLIGGLGMLIIGSLMTTRLVLEERMLLDHFGEEYRRYMRRTSPFLPRPKRRPREELTSSSSKGVDQAGQHEHKSGLR